MLEGALSTANWLLTGRADIGYPYRTMSRTGVTRILSALFAAIALSVAPSPLSGQTDVELRQHLVSFFQRGGSLEEMPAGHPLKPLARLPLVATTSYLLLEEDEGMLARYYPQISRIVLERLDREKMTGAGLLPCTAAAGEPAGVYLSLIHI